MLLIQTPICDFTQPGLGVPVLVSYLKQYSKHNVKQLDLSIELFDRLLQENILQQALDYIVTSENEEIRAKISNSYIYKKLPYYIDEAKSILRDKEEFYNFEKYIFAMNVIKLSLNLINYAMNDFFITEDFSFEFKDKKFDSSIQVFEECMRSFNNSKFNPIKRCIDSEIIKFVKEFSPKVIGISNVYNSQDFFTIYLTNFIKTKFSDIVLVLGGPAIAERLSLIKEEKQEEVYKKFLCRADYFIINEGEKALHELLNYLEGYNSDISNIKNLMYFDKITGRFVKNELQYIQDLNCVPTPEFNDNALTKYLIPENVLPLAPTRGCYWGKCTFCSYGFYDKNKAAARYRQVSPQKLIQDLRYLKEKHGVSFFSFNCDTISPSTAEKYSKKIIESELDVKWMSDFRMERVFVDHEKISLLRESGLLYMSFGMETYSQNVLDAMNKGVKNQYFNELIEILDKNDIVADLMLFKGFPNETWKDYKETLKFLVQNEKRIHCPISMGEFVLLTNSYIGKHPEEFGLKLMEPSEENQLFNLDLMSFEKLENNKKEYDVEAEKLEERIFDNIFLGERPWVGGNQTAHSLLYTNRFGKTALKKMNDIYSDIKFITLNYYT